MIRKKIQYRNIDHEHSTWNGKGKYRSFVISFDSLKCIMLPDATYNEQNKQEN